MDCKHADKDNPLPNFPPRHYQITQDAFRVSSITFDTDGDGLLDLIEAPRFSSPTDYRNQGIEDLDGASQLSSLTTLDLTGNQITSIDAGDIQGPSSLKAVDLSDKPITELNFISSQFAKLRNVFLG
ncbi:MAG: leucine-rich repeat domain-containing protein [Planctomycetaceae bacterium]|nr:leucine-rich repeat domain-containing protein [Planctomycetaceae bacterium]